MKIYTRTGDDGTTGLYGGERRAKSDPRVAAYGSVDEANSVIGLARAHLMDDGLDSVLAEVQNALFDVGADLATPLDARQRSRIDPLNAADVARLEGMIDRFSEELEPLSAFILPGGTAAAAALHLARTVTRRAEREVIALREREPVSAELIAYLNRLSDLLFTLARLTNVRQGVSETRWSVRGRTRE